MAAALLWILLVLLLLLLVVILFPDAEETAEEAALLGFGLFLRLVVLSILRARLAGLRLVGRQHGGPGAGRQLLLLLRAAQPEELLEEVPLVFVGVRAGIARGCAVEESGIVVIRAGLVCEQVGVLVELD